MAVRVVATSILALCLQIFLTIRHPDYLLWIQEAVRAGSKALSAIMDIPANYRVAYNLLNGDGILVHTVFILIVFVGLALLFGIFVKLLFSRRR